MANNKQNRKKELYSKTPTIVLALSICTLVFPLIFILVMFQVDIIPNFIGELTFEIFMVGLICAMLSLVFGIRYIIAKKKKSYTIYSGMIVSSLILVMSLVLLAFAISNSRHDYYNNVKDYHDDSRGLLCTDDVTHGASCY